MKRFAATVGRRIRQAAKIYSADGGVALLARLADAAQRRSPKLVSNVLRAVYRTQSQKPQFAAYRLPADISRLDHLTPALLIITDESGDRQIALEADALQARGWIVRHINHTDEQGALAALQLTTRLIFVGTHSTETIERFTAEAGRLQVPIWRLQQRPFGDTVDGRPLLVPVRDAKSLGKRGTRYQADTAERARFWELPGASLKPETAPLRVMLVNTYYKPRSYGGATLVAEEMARRLGKREVEVAVFTTQETTQDGNGRVLRYCVDDQDVLSVPTTPGADYRADEPAGMAAAFGRWLDSFRPNIVHVHALQTLGLSLLTECRLRNIPYVITLHDSWWLCYRQFMVKADGHFCFQTKIDLAVCEACNPEASDVRERAAAMREGLEHAAYLLSPGRTHRALHIANGIPAERIGISRNGFLRPMHPRTPRSAAQPVRFGFVGGNEAVKGYPLIRTVFETLSHGNWELVLVDNKLNLGTRSMFVGHWKTKGLVRVVPAYTTTSLDDFYDQIDVLLFPSQWEESYGLTVREALARDIWVIATQPGGQAEDVRDGENGTLISLSGDPDELRAAVERVIQDAPRLENYSNPYKDDLASYEQQVSELHALYESLLGRRRPGT